MVRYGACVDPELRNPENGELRNNLLSRHNINFCLSVYFQLSAKNQAKSSENTINKFIQKTCKGINLKMEFFITVYFLRLDQTGRKFGRRIPRSGQISKVIK